MSTIKGAATANVANSKTLTGDRAELVLRKRFPNLYVSMMSEKTVEETAIETVLDTFTISIENAEIKRENDYSEFIPQGRNLGSKVNNEGIIAQMNKVQFLAPYAMAESLKEFNQEMLEFEIKEMEKREAEVMTAEKDFIRDMDFYEDEKGNTVYVPTKTSDSVVFFRTSTNKVAFKLIQATTESIKAGLSPADAFLSTYKKAIKNGKVLDAKGKEHRVSSNTIFNSFVYSQEIDGKYESVNWGPTVYHIPTSAIRLSRLGFMWAKAENAKDWKELNKTLANRIVKSSIAQGYAMLVAPTEELAREMETPYINCGAKFSMQGTIGFMQDLKSKQKAKVIVRTITDANINGIIETGKGINNIAGNTIFVSNLKSPSRKMHVLRKEEVEGLVIPEWTRLKLATQGYFYDGISLEVNGTNQEQFYIMSANEIKFKRDEETLEVTPVMSDSPEIITALETFSMSKEVGVFNFHGATEEVTVYTVALAEDEYNSSYYNAKSLKGAKSYESFMAVLDKDLISFVMAKYMDFASMNNAIELSQYNYSHVSFREEMKRNRLVKEIVESKVPTGLTTFKDEHKTVWDLEGNEAIATNDIVVKSLMGEINICYAQVTNLISFIEYFTKEALFDSTEDKKSMVPIAYREKMVKFLASLIKEAMKAGYTKDDVLDRLLELKELIVNRAFEKMNYEIIQFQTPVKYSKGSKAIGGGLVNVSCKIDSFQFANALEVNKKRVLVYYNEIGMENLKEELAKAHAEGNMVVASRAAQKIADIETRMKRNEEGMKSQWNKLRATIHAQLKKGVYSFFKGQDTLYTSLQFRTTGLAIDEILIPRNWANKYQIGDYVLVFRHPVICSVLVLKVVGYTDDSTIQINHMLSKNIEADADGDNINVWLLDQRDWSVKAPTIADVTFSAKAYRELIAAKHANPNAEVSSYDDFTTDSINNYVGKMMTYELTGQVGHFIRRVLMAYRLNDKPLTQREIEEVAILEQICVQGKNIGKRGLYENDPEVQLAVKAAKNLSYSLDIEAMVKNFFNSYIGKEEVIATVESFEEFFGI